MGGIYTKMMECGYRDFAERKFGGTETKLVRKTREVAEFDPEKFREMLERLGKVAWGMQQSGNQFLRLSDVIGDVFEDAFDYPFAHLIFDCGD